MATSIERRLESLERGAMVGNEITLIAIQLVSPGNLQPANRFCKIEGVTYTCGADESSSEFDRRMRAVAEGLNRRLGKPIRIILSPDDLDLQGLR